MARRACCRHQGFTLIELLIVVAIIGLLAAMLIPNLIDAMQKAKQKRTMADQRLIGTGMMSWLTDQATAAAAGASSGILDLSKYSPIGYSALEAELVPQYLQALPQRDGWKRDFDFYFDAASPESAVMAIRSAGQDLVPATDAYTPGAFDPTDYAQDIVWADGFFVRWPQKTS